MNRRAAPSALAAFVVVVTTSGLAQQQPNERDDWSRRVDAARERHDAFAAQAVAQFRDAVAARKDEEPQTLRLDDPTLRPGDIVVTPSNLLMFKGVRGADCEDDFERIDELRAGGLPHARTLRAILRAGFTRRR